MSEQREWDYQVVEALRVVDGDTFDLTLSKSMDFGFRLVEDKRWSARFRLLGVDTFELNEAGGAAAKAFAEAWLASAILANALRGQTFKSDNFGRWLIDLYRTDSGVHLKDELIGNDLGAPYLK